MRTRLLVGLVVVLAACSGAAAETTLTTTATSSTTTSTTRPTTTTTRATTTTVDTRPRSPINGLPVDDPSLLDRRVLAVKIDNHWDARPQSGILQADGVFEIRVEGGLTRFMPVFHDADSEMLGPIRSGRPADAAIVRPLDATLFISGGQAWVKAGIKALGVPYISDPRPGMFRIDTRFAPHNLYGNTTELRQVADDRGISDDPPPVALWKFGDLPSGGEPASEISFTFSGSTKTTWTWDGSQYLRSINGDESDWVKPDGNTERIHVDLMVAIVGHQYTASPPSGYSGSSVPATETTGTGPAYVFADGKVVSGTWSRETATDGFTLTTDDGQDLLVPPGMPWISIVPDTGEVAWDNPPVTTTSTTVTSTTGGG